MKKVWVIWFYDNAICPDKQLWEICASEEIAEQVKGCVEKSHPDYEFEIEERSVTTEFRAEDYKDED